MKKVIVTNFLFLFFILFSGALFAQPTLSAPADKAAGVSIEPIISWVSVPGATTYRLQISTDKTFATVTYETVVNEPSTSWTPATAAERLENNKQYYWHVRANVSPYPYSEIRTFYTISAVTPVLTYPVKNVKLYTTSANFAWYTTPYSPGVKYDLLYSNAEPVDNMLVSPTLVSDLEDAYYTLDPLEGGKTYYWQVRSKSAGGTITSYSAIESFSTPADPGAIVPTPGWPVKGATVYTSKPDFFWYLGSADPGLQFKVYYSNTSFSNTTDAGVKFTDWSSDSYASVTEDLQPGDYYWRVQSRLASDTTKESSLSAEAHFKVYSGLAQTAPVPVPSWPVGNATVYSTSVQFCWYLNTYVPGLYFQMRYKKLSDADYGDSTDWSTESYASLDGLTAGETYLWQVRSSPDGTDGKASGWSTVEAKFKIDGGIVPAAVVPTPSWPVKGTTVYSKTPYFSWYVGADGTGLQYLVEYADDKDFNVNKVTLDPTTDLFISGSENALAAGKEYYWHVKSSLDGLTWSEPSAAANFKVVADAAVKPLKPIASSPWPGTQITTTSAELQWYLPGSASGLKFRVEVYYSTYSEDNFFTSVSDLTEMTTTVSGLTPGATYAWVVYSYEDGNESNISDHSAVASFTVSPGVSSSIVPLTGSPVKGVKIKTDSPVLSWFCRASSSQLKYEVQYSLNKDMSEARSLTGIESSFKALSGLTAGSKYYWRVRSFNKDGKPSAFSSIESFVAASVTGVEKNNTMIPAEFEVAQNYPNPFNPSTTIKVSLPAAAFLSVKIYNMLGQEVRTLINARTQAGVHQVIWHGEDNSGSILPSGAYIYRVRAGNNVTSGKMMFLK
ncbi:MAG TPA: fibronectin type III domain-containing protein [Ignavibacteriales bacterium]|nr:fibronectin type III domain-containing protein [Ignavibacteriales bacterium]